MSDFITEHSLGFSVYGQKQVDYIVDGTPDCSFGQAVSMAALNRAAGIRMILGAFIQSVRKRQTKMNELGRAISVFAKLAAQFAPKDSTGTTKKDGDLPAVYAICQKYGIDLHGASGDSIRKDQIQLVQTSVQYAMDMENTDLQQDMVQMQNYVEKQDSALSLASTLLKKTAKTVSTGIRNIT